MQTVNLKFQSREIVNKKISQAVDRFFAGSRTNSILESGLRNAVSNLEFQTGISSELDFGRLSKQ